MNDVLHILPPNIPGYVARVVRSAMRLYLDHGIKVNTAYTPKNMRAFVTKITNKPYPASRKGLEAAYVDLNALINGTYK